MVRSEDEPCLRIPSSYSIVSTGYRGCMDVLSDVIAVMRTGQARSAQVTWHAPWAQQFASVPGSAGFQIILQGSCWLIQPHIHQRYATGTVGAPTGTDPDTAVTITLCGAYRLDPARAHPLFYDLPELIHLPGHLRRRPELQATVALLATELERPRLGTDAIVPALLDTLLLHILRSLLDQQPTPGTTTGWAAALNDPATNAALQAIHRDPARPWTVAMLAAEAGLSRAPFARRFTTLVGQPPLTYLTWWRMTTAARLLQQSDAPLSAIAARVGYTSEFAFANAFKRQYAAAPGRYRRT